MTIKENVPLKANGLIDLDNRNYITLGLTYNEFLDLKALMNEILRSSTPGSASGNKWVDKCLLVERNARLAANLLKRLNKIM